MARFKNKIEILTYLYIVVFTIIMVILLQSVNIKLTFGEHDDYTMPAISFINDQNFTISQEDWAYAKASFPNWADYYTASQNNHGLLSTRETHNDTGVDILDKHGNQLTWYFPLYSAYLVPFIAATKILNVPCEYSVKYANFFALLALLIATTRFKSFKPLTRLMMIVALSINPILLILKWGSAETFMYVLLALSVLFWLSKRYNWAGLFCALAGMVNTTILFWGIVMIAEYLIRMYNEHKGEDSFIKIYLKRWKTILLYALCFVPALIPMVYFYYYMGTITPQGGSFYVGGTIKAFWGRFFSYLFDLNLGMLPYFTILLIGFFVAVVYSIIKRKPVEFLWLAVAFIGTMLAYSIHLHINCGMAGIARYNNWNSVYLCIGIPYFVESLSANKKINITLNSIIAVGIVLTGLVTFGVYKSKTNSYHTYFTPVARFALDHCPGLYNPYPRTFYNRTNHVDNDYDPIPYPVIYSDNNGHIRKILLTEDSIEELEQTVIGSDSSITWLQKQLSKVDGQSYISVPTRYNLVVGGVYFDNSARPLYEAGLDSARKYIASGVQLAEGDYGWTSSNEIIIKPFIMSDFSADNNYEFVFKVYGTYNGNQTVRVYINNRVGFDEKINVAWGEIETFRIPISTPGDGIFDIRIELPDAISPNAISGSPDTRVLSLALNYMNIEISDN